MHRYFTRRREGSNEPLQRLLALEFISKANKIKHEEFFLRLNPAKLRRDIHDLEMGLHRFTMGIPLDQQLAHETALVAAPEQGGPNVQNA